MPNNLIADINRPRRNASSSRQQQHQPSARLTDWTQGMVTSEQPPLDIRQEVFRQLVERQDSGTPVVQSRAEMESQFSLSPEQVLAIEKEGSTNNWPPLS